MRYRTLDKNWQFNRVYGRGKSYVHPHCVLYVAKNRLGYTRIGLTATKKVGHAVQRNRARRVMRAALSEHLARQGRPGPRARDGPAMIARLLIALLRGYKKYISPHLGHHCRFIPTCSEYAMQALAVHGLVKGLILTVWRLLRCQPFAKFGYDPVPEKGKWVNPERRLTKDNR